MRGRAPLWLAVASTLGAVACADVWGMKDLTEGVEAGLDATAAPADANDEPDSDQSEAEAADADDSLDAGDASADAASSVAGDGAIGDGGDAATLQNCLATCLAGCCDTGGKCQKGTTTAACGSPGHACAVCNASCGFGFSNCCNTNQNCTCAAAGVCL
jgi:hypothetical protein